MSRINVNDLVAVTGPSTGVVIEGKITAIWHDKWGDRHATIRLANGAHATYPLAWCRRKAESDGSPSELPPSLLSGGT